MKPSARKYSAAVVLVLAAVLGLAARIPAGTWTIDDAAITYSYAVHVAAGHGSTVFEGGMPTEGFSNPLTLVLNVILLWLGLFHPLVSHVVLETILFAAACVLVFLFLEKTGARRPVALAGAGLFTLIQLATPACRVWYFSGLENAQLTLGIAMLLVRLLDWAATAPRPWLDGPLLFVFCLIRPEAPLYPMSLLLVFALHRAVAPARHRRSWSWLRPTALTAAVAAGLGLLALAGRYLYFGAILPNTYHAKATGAFHAVASGGPWRNFSEYVVGDLLQYQHTWLLLLFGLIAGRKPALVVLGILGLAVASLALPVLSGPDWMGEHRFGTATLTLCQLLFVTGLATAADAALRRSTGSRGLEPYALVALGAGLVVASVWTGLPRYERFIRYPHATLEVIADVGGFVRLGLQRRLGLTYPSVYQPDAGGTNYVGRAQSIDGLRLTDFHMARVYRRPAELLRYVYLERTPELIVAHHRIPRSSDFASSYFNVLRVANPGDANRPIPYFARRDAVETPTLDPGSILIRRDDDLEVWLSGRTVPVAVPEAIVRVELLLRPTSRYATAAAAKPESLEVCLGGDCDELRPFFFHPDQPQALMPVVGRFYRHGFLVRAPAAAGSHSLSIGLGARGARAGGDPPPILVTADPLAAPLAARLGARGGDVLERAFLLAQLREQCRPRMARAELRATLERFRQAAAARSWSARGAFDALIGEFHSRPPRRVEGALEELEGELSAEVSDAVSAVLDKATKKQRLEEALAAARLAYNLRRQGFERATRTPGMSRAARLLRRELAARKGVQARYQAALGLAALRPADTAVQKELLELRRLVMSRSRQATSSAPGLYQP